MENKLSSRAWAFLGALFLVVACIFAAVPASADSSVMVVVAQDSENELDKCKNCSPYPLCCKKHKTPAMRDVIDASEAMQESPAIARCKKCPNCICRPDRPPHDLLAELNYAYIDPKG